MEEDASELAEREPQEPLGPITASNPPVDSAGPRADRPKKGHLV